MLLLATSTRKGDEEEVEVHGLGCFGAQTRCARNTRQDWRASAAMTWTLTVCLCRGRRDRGHRDSQW